MEKWMQYTVGEQVRYIRTGQIGTVTEVDVINEVYTVNINGIDYSIKENELN